MKNKCVLVTGAGMGLGREIALKFAEDGAILILWDIKKDLIERVSNEIRIIQENFKKNEGSGNSNGKKNISSKSKGVFVVQCDVSSRESVAKAASQTRSFIQEVKSSSTGGDSGDITGFVDVLVNNAGWCM